MSRLYLCVILVDFCCCVFTSSSSHGGSDGGSSRSSPTLRMLPARGVGRSLKTSNSFFTASNSTDGFPHARDSKVLSPGHPKCRTMVVKRTPREALNSLLPQEKRVEDYLRAVCSHCNKERPVQCTRCVYRMRVSKLEKTMKRSFRHPVPNAPGK